MHQRIEVEPSVIGGSGVPEGIAHPGMGVLMHRQEQQEHCRPAEEIDHHCIVHGVPPVKNQILSQDIL